MRQRPYRDRLLAIGIVVLGFALRVGRPTLVEFKWDEAMVVRRVFFILFWGQRPLVGATSSLGIPYPPHFLYLMSLPLALWPDPLAAVLFLAFLNTLAVALAYVIGVRYLSRPAGVIAAFLFAVSPWAVLYARKIWTQNIPLFTLLFVLSLLGTFVARRPWALAGALASLSILIGLHLEGVAFVLVLAPLMLLYRREVKLLPLLAGLAAAIMLLGPYVWHDMHQGWPAARQALAYSKRPSQFSWDALRIAFRLADGDGIYALAGQSYAAYVQSLPPLWSLSRVIDVLLVAGLAHALWRALRCPEHQRRVYVILLLWFSIPVVLLIRHKSPVYPHYFIPLFPVQMFLIGGVIASGIGWLQGRVNRGSLLHWAWGATVVGLLLYGAWQVVALERLLTVVDRMPTEGGFGLPLKYHRRASLAAARLAAGSQVIVLTEGTGLGIDPLPTILNAVLFPYDHRFADVREAVPIPAGAASYLVGPVHTKQDDVEEVEDILVGRVMARGVGVVPLPGGREYRLYRKEPGSVAPPWTDYTSFPRSVQLDNGVTLLGFRLSQCFVPGRSLSLYLLWRVVDVPPTSYSFFVHLLDEEGRQVAVRDAGGFPPMFWRKGDIVATRVGVQVPTDVKAQWVRLRVGMYAYPDGHRARVLSPEEWAGQDFLLLPGIPRCAERS